MWGKPEKLESLLISLESGLKKGKDNRLDIAENDSWQVTSFSLPVFI